MGTIVAGYGTGHILMKRHSAGDSGERVFRGMQEIGRRCATASPDVLVIVSSDHMYNFDLSLQAPFIVGVSDEYVPYGDMNLPARRVPGQRSFAAGFVAYSAGRGFDLAQAEEYRPDHGIILPNTLMNPRCRIPIVPILTNVAMDPAPAPSRCWQLGQVLASYVREQRPRDERVVVIGAGGLSHWLGVPEMGKVAPDFDRYVLDAFVAGHAAEIACLTAADVVARGGNGGLEIVNWLMMGGAVGSATGEQIYYEAIPQWMTGLGGLELRPLAAAGVVS